MWVRCFFFSNTLSVFMRITLLRCFFHDLRVRLGFLKNRTKICVRDGVVSSLIKESTPVSTLLTGPFVPLAFPFSWQAVPGPAIFCNLLSVGQNQFMALQPIIFTSIRRDRRESAFHSSANRGPAAPPSLTTQPMQIHLTHAIESL